MTADWQPPDCELSIGMRLNLIQINYIWPSLLHLGGSQIKGKD
jgi:hypothetical protein